MTWEAAFAALERVVASRAELLAAGASGAGLTAAVRAGHLLRLRRDHYALPSAPTDVRAGVRVGGRLTCTNALRHHGVFPLDDGSIRVHVDRAMSRLRHPGRRRAALRSDNRDGLALHWGTLLDPHDGSEVAVGVRDALACAVRCEHPWFAVASFDNALFLGLIDESDIAEIFRALPASSRRLRRLIDGRAESGQESVLRQIVREAGLNYELQVTYEGIGRVDLVVENRLVLEADSRLAHDGWEKQVRDRTRDLLLARSQLMSLRPVYQHIMFDPALVRNAILGLLRA